MWNFQAASPTYFSTFLKSLQGKSNAEYCYVTFSISFIRNSLFSSCYRCYVGGGGLAAEPKGRNFQRLAASRRAVGVKKSARALSTQKRCWRALGKSTFLREIEFLAAEIFCFQFWQKSETGRSPTRKKNHPSDNFFVWGPFFWSKIKQKEINRQCWVCNVQITRRRWCPGTRRRRWTTPTRPTPFQTSGSRCRRKCLRPSRKSRHRLRRRPEQLRRPFHLRWRRRRPSAARSTRSTRARRRSRGSRQEQPSDPSTSIKNQTCPLVSF